MEPTSSGLGVIELSALITACCTFIYTVGTLFLWWTTRKSVRLIRDQVEYQIQSSRSSAYHHSLNAHRDLQMGILGDEKLIGLYSSEINIAPDVLRRKMLASIMINHALSIFLDHQNNLAFDQKWDGFISDASDMFSIPFIRKRWEEVKQFHPESFRLFIDSDIRDKIDSNSSSSRIV